MRIIAGLGNPGKKYEDTRHNVGYMALDILAGKLGVDMTKKKFHGLTGETRAAGDKVLLLKPETFMNESGISIREAADFYKVSPEDILVIYDDFDIETGTIRIRKFGSAGTHNGMRSVVEHLGTEKFPRIRIGTGTGNMENKDLIGFVLGAFQGEEKEKIESAIERAADAAVFSLDNDMDLVMNKFNGK